MLVHPAGRLGGVLLAFRYAYTILRSPRLLAVNVQLSEAAAVHVPSAVIEEGSRGGGFIVTVAELLFVGSATLVAMTLIACCVWTVGELYNPLDEIVPRTGLNDQVTAVFALFETVAINCWCCPPVKVTVPGVNFIEVTTAVSTKLAAELFKVAAICTLELLVADVTCTVKVSLLDPAGTVTEDGAEMETVELFAYPSEMFAPLPVAGPLRDMVHEVEPGTLTVDGEQDTLDSVGPVDIAPPVAITVIACAPLETAMAPDTEIAGLEAVFDSVAFTTASCPSVSASVFVAHIMQLSRPADELLQVRVLLPVLATDPTVTLKLEKSEGEYVKLHSIPAIELPPFAMDKGNDMAEPAAAEVPPRLNATPCPLTAAHKPKMAAPKTTIRCQRDSITCVTKPP